jgi:type I restriction enzyme S subunit
MPTKPPAKKQHKAAAQLRPKPATTPPAQNSEGLPDGWRKVSLGEVANYINGKAFKPTEWSREGLPIIRIQNLNRNKSEFNYCNFKVDEKYFVNSGDLLFAWSGTPDTSFGAHIWKGPKAVLNQHIFRIVVNEQIISKSYYLHALNHKVKEFVSKAHGTAGLAHITKKKFEESEIYLPPLPTQHAIVSKIEELLSELDKGKQQLETAQQQLRVYRQAVLKWAFEGKLTGEWRNKNKNIKSSIEYLNEVSKIRKDRYLLAKQNKEKKIEANYDFEFEQSGLIKSWAKGKLDKLIYIAGRIGWRGLTKDEYKNDGPMFLSVHSLNYGKYVEFKDAYHISKERYLESPEIILKEQDILLCKDGAGIGKIGIVHNLQSEATVNSSLLVIRALEIFIPEFLYYLFSGPALQTIVRERITGSATPHLFQNDIRKFELLIPPLEEQKKIVQEIESRLSVCDKIEETIDQSLAQAETLRQSILKKAFEGKLI